MYVWDFWGCSRGRPSGGLQKIFSEVPVPVVKSIHKQQTTIRKPIECAPEASSGGREWAEMTEGFHLEATRHRC